jgi:hypothetical protein
VSLPATVSERVCRLALLNPRPVDVPYGNTGSRIVGWLIEPDENWSRHDGLGLVKALQDQAEADWPRLRARAGLKDGKV